MMRRIGLLVLIGLCAGAGCSQAPARHAQREAAFGPAPAPMQLASSLLFDPSPGLYNPSAFAQRSEWPSTTAYYQTGQTIYFTEHFYDFQGRGRNPDWTYRRFETFRSGTGYR